MNCLLHVLSVGKKATKGVNLYVLFSFHPIYHGPSHSHKMNRLSELTEYEFRIYASNEAGDGPYSDVCRFSTTKAPPPAVKRECATCAHQNKVELQKTHASSGRWSDVSVLRPHSGYQTGLGRANQQRIRSCRFS